jgi:hypothetical protein
MWVEYLSDELEVGLDSRAYGGAFTGVIQLDVSPGVIVPFSNLKSIQNPPGIPGLPGVQEEVDSLLADHPRGPERACPVRGVGWNVNDFFLGLNGPVLLDSVGFPKLRFRGRSLYQRHDVVRHARPQAAQVVTALEHAHEAAACMFFRRFDQVLRHPAKGLGREVQWLMGSPLSVSNPALN